MERKFSIYKITSPSGKCYIGLTLSKVKERWRQHVKRSRTGINHPFYNAIRKYGHDIFNLEILEYGLTSKQACEAEIKHIAAIPAHLRYNISAGGENDGAAAGKAFWVRIRKDPEALKQYLKKLSEIKKLNDWTDYSALAIGAKKWKEDNVREAYKIRMRASRIAAGGRKKIKKELPLKERLLLKHKNISLAKKRATTKMWSSRSTSERETVGANISKSLKNKWKTVAAEDRPALTSAARAAINRSTQGPAASRGIKNFWVELKKDPVRYKEYMTARTASLLVTLKSKKNENL